ncbi:tetratricopeptide repeat protein, partial [bacterium]|nr:tetratricopeptide repeat protein [bacterium]
QPLKSIRYYKLVVEKFPNSKYAPDALFEMGEYFFNNNNVFKAIPNYKTILDRHKTNKFFDFALYKYAWCMYNVGEYGKSVKLFQKVVERAAKDGKKVDLKEDALKDMVAPYAEAGTVDDAERYFKNIVKNKKYYIMVLRKLAQIYFEQDRSKDAVIIYRKLLGEAALSTSAPGWQKQIVEASKKMNDKDGVRKEIVTLVRNYANPESAWYKANKKDESAILSASQTAETALRLLTVDYHNEARKTKSQNTWTIVGELYPSYLKYFPKSEASYDMRFNYAEYLYDHKKYQLAGDQYQIVADVNAKGSHFEDASFGAVSCFGALLEGEQKKAKDAAKRRIIAAKKAGAGSIRKEDITVGGKKKKNSGIAAEFKPKEIPDLQKRYIKACKTYIENIPRSKYLVDIIYQQAITYYAFNHFENAVPVFEMIVKKYPRHRLAEFAADLIMDSLNMSKNWEVINNKSREFLRNAPLLSGRNRLRKDLEKFKEMSSFYSSEVPAQKGKQMESADRYLAFVAEFPKSQFNDVALYNAIVYYQQGG